MSSRTRNRSREMGYSSCSMCSFSSQPNRCDFLYRHFLPFLSLAVRVGVNTCFQSSEPSFSEQSLVVQPNKTFGTTGRQPEAFLCSFLSHGLRT